MKVDLLYISQLNDLHYLLCFQIDGRIYALFVSNFMNWAFLIMELKLFFESNFSYQQHYLLFMKELRLIFLVQAILLIAAGSFFREFVMLLASIHFQASKFSNS